MPKLKKAAAANTVVVLAAVVLGALLVVAVIVRRQERFYADANPNISADAKSWLHVAESAGIKPCLVRASDSRDAGVLMPEHFIKPSTQLAQYQASIGYPNRDACAVSMQYMDDNTCTKSRATILNEPALVDFAAPISATVRDGAEDRETMCMLVFKDRSAMRVGQLADYSTRNNPAAMWEKAKKDAAESTAARLTLTQQVALLKSQLQQRRNCVIESQDRSTWTPVTPCSKQCGNGMHMVAPKIIAPASNGGTPCPPSEVRACHTPKPCPNAWSLIMKPNDRQILFAWGFPSPRSVTSVRLGVDPRLQHVVYGPMGSGPMSPSRYLEPYIALYDASHNLRGTLFPGGFATSTKNMRRRATLYDLLARDEFLSRPNLTKADLTTFTNVSYIAVRIAQRDFGPDLSPESGFGLPNMTSISSPLVR